ncbi:MAG: hypothetical protein A2091_02695 [Desulfuromonadales bacterium GWD2_61_12]|nr:MAG: hypothetical protein A2005_10900 [Desulfuromonadales bacterium GWC2_61_20]OGR35825.1 MAG: hypothetical protein A2091_02695 [Desulfuromonadales bacterium GWD2_61_12]
MARIMMTEKGTVLREFLLNNETTRIGRERINHIRIDNPTVSRFHAEIYRRGCCYSIEDKMSRNGTCVNGFPVENLCVLGDKDEIVIGESTLVFVLEISDFPEPLKPSSLDSRETVYILKDQE